jgi:hypothetical protein
LISAGAYCLSGRFTCSVILLAETTRVLAKMSWPLVKFMMLLTLTGAPGSVEIKSPNHTKDPPPYFAIGMWYFSAYGCVFQHQTHCWCEWLKSSIFILSDHITSSNPSANAFLSNSRRCYGQAVLWSNITKMNSGHHQPTSTVTQHYTEDNRRS